MKKKELMIEFLNRRIEILTTKFNKEQQENRIKIIQECKDIIKENSRKKAIKIILKKVANNNKDYMELNQSRLLIKQMNNTLKKEDLEGKVEKTDVDAVLKYYKDNLKTMKQEQKNLKIQNDEYLYICSVINLQEDTNLHYLKIELGVDDVESE